MTADCFLETSPFAQHSFLVSLLEELPFDRAEPVHEEQSVEVVYLVLEGPRKQPGALDLERLPMPVQGFYHHTLGPFDRCQILGDAEAALLALHEALGFKDLGVDEDQKRMLLLADAHVDHDETLRSAHLRGGQADTRSRVHGLQHVVDETLEAAVDRGDRLSLALQHFVGVFPDLPEGHEKLYHSGPASWPEAASPGPVPGSSQNLFFWCRVH